MKTLLAVILAATLCSCATKPVATAEDITRAGAMDGAIKAAQTPLFELTCPVSGCVIGNIKVGNPSAVGQLADIAKVAFAPTVSEAGQNFRAVLGVIGQVGGYATIGHFASAITGKIVGGYTAGFESNVAISKNIQAPGAITTNTIGGQGVIGSGTLTDRHDTSSIINTDRHDSVVNPPGKTCVPTYNPVTGLPSGFVCN